MERKPYSAGAVKFAFWFLEFKKVVTLLASGMNIQEIKALNTAENIFAASSADRAKIIMSTVERRIKALDDSFIKLFMASDVVGQKQLCLTACMCSDTLFFDYVYEIIRTKIRLGVNEYNESDIRRFWSEKQVQSEKVASFTDATINRLSRTYKQYLSAAGITDNSAGTKKIAKPIIALEIEKWLCTHDLEPIISALTGA